MSRYLVSTLLRPLKDNSESSIIITVAINGKRLLRYPSGFRAANGKREPQDSIQKRKLNKLRADLEIAIEKFEEEYERMPGKNDLKEMMEILTGKRIKSESSIFSDIDKYINAYKLNEAGIKVSYSSRKIRKQIKNNLKEFDSSVTYNDINADYLDGFAAYLTQKGLTNHSIALYISVFKSFLRQYAPDRIGTNYLKCKYRKQKKTKEQKAKKWALSYEEIKELENLELSERLSYYRSAFLLLLFSSQRLSDIGKLHKGNVEINGGGRKVLRFTQQKTGNDAKIPITPQLERWLNVTNWKPITNINHPWQMNIPLKEISTILFEKIAKKNKEEKPKDRVITSRVARYSGASLMYFHLKLPISICRSVTCHTSESNFLLYLDPDSVDDTEAIIDAFKGLE